MFNGNIPDDALRRMVRKNAFPVTVYRNSDDTQSAWSSGSVSGNYTELAEKRDALLFSANEFERGTQAGDESEGSLSGFMLPNVDIQLDDRVDYGDTTYEVDTILDQPSPRDVAVKELSLSRV